VLYLLIPVRNEAERIGGVLESLGPALQHYHAPHRILVVDGDSSDATAKVARRFMPRLPLDVLELRHDCGLGGALEAGFRTALPDADAIVTLYGNGSHDARSIYPMLGRLAEGYDVVIASRFPPAGRPPLGRRVASRLTRWRFPMGAVADYTCGLRAYRATTLEQLKQERGRLIEEPGRACQLELLLHLRGIGARAAEVPFVWPRGTMRRWKRGPWRRHLAVALRSPRKITASLHQR
jgi:glycosyltransferase involved in cell wall biosynthesis